MVKQRYALKYAKQRGYWRVGITKIYLFIYLVFCQAFIYLVFNCFLFIYLFIYIFIESSFCYDLWDWSLITPKLSIAFFGSQRFEARSIIIIIISVIIFILMTLRVSKRWDPRDMTLRLCVIRTQSFGARSAIIIIIIIIIMMTRHGLVACSIVLVAVGGTTNVSMCVRRHAACWLNLICAALWNTVRSRRFTGLLTSPPPDQEGNKLQRQKILIFIHPIYNHNWININTIYIYIYIYITRLASNEIF